MGISDHQVKNEVNSILIFFFSHSPFILNFAPSFIIINL